MRGGIRLKEGHMTSSLFVAAAAERPPRAGAGEATRGGEDVERSRRSISRRGGRRGRRPRILLAIRGRLIHIPGRGMRRQGGEEGGSRGQSRRALSGSRRLNLSSRGESGRRICRRRILGGARGGEGARGHRLLGVACWGPFAV